MIFVIRFIFDQSAIYFSDNLYIFCYSIASTREEYYWNDIVVVFSRCNACQKDSQLAHLIQRG